MRETLAPYLAISALGVGTLEPIPPKFREVPQLNFNTRRTGIAASRRAAKKERNKRRTR